MKKRIALVLSLVLCFSMFWTLKISSKAGDINDPVTATGANGKITVSGTTGADVLACAVLVYDEGEANFITMETCPTNAGSGSNSFQYTLTYTFTEGNYVVKVSDYDGGSFKTTTVTVTAPGGSNNPDGGNNSGSSDGNQSIASPSPSVTPSPSAEPSGGDENGDSNSEQGGEGNEDTASPKTGDSGMEVIWSSCLIMTIGGILISSAKRKVK